VFKFLFLTGKSCYKLMYQNLRLQLIGWYDTDKFSDFLREIDSTQPWNMQKALLNMTNIKVNCMLASGMRIS
jgi:hypothetical protein